MSVSRCLLPLALVVVVLGFMLLTAGDALADVQACLNASEKGQRARSAGRLREAREHFVVCGAENCPALVRHDCAQWNSELASTLPTVVFGARDKQGRDLFDVTVAMDGEVVLKKLDGKSVTVDPGKHTFRFETAGLPPVTETALIKEGERARVINVTFDGTTATSGGGVKDPKDPTWSVRPPPGEDSSKGGHTAYPWIVVGVGAVATAVGVVILLTTPDRPSNCNADTQKCTRAEGQSAEDFRKDQERAGTADSQPVLGLVVGGAGLLAVVGGLVWHFLEPTEDGRSSGKLGVSPWTTGTASGLGLTRSF